MTAIQAGLALLCGREQRPAADAASQGVPAKAPRRRREDAPAPLGLGRTRLMTAKLRAAANTAPLGEAPGSSASGLVPFNIVRGRASSVPPGHPQLRYATTGLREAGEDPTLEMSTEGYLSVESIMIDGFRLGALALKSRGHVELNTLVPAG
ncbi:hypothetical protein WJX81_006829 [Elliptochloris bilobata]|uniref:Uncharacterized protein n=1 Tax=Elliptochloris bilobata TaxID=381761 RepID=A0AAW1S547_9CHLO